MNIKHRALARVAAPPAAVLVWGFACMAYASMIVVPNANTSVEGDISNVIPFASPARFQQVYAAAEFPSAPILITQLTFRPEPPPNQEPFAFPFSQPNYQINLSTTHANPDGLSLTFADNVGADDTIVRSGELFFSTNSSGPAAGPKDFDIAIEISPFMYDPSRGNLLLDVRPVDLFYGIFSLDAAASTSDGLSRVYLAADVTDVRADSVGLITQFTYTRIPEPSSLALAALVSFAVAVASRRHFK